MRIVGLFILFVLCLPLKAQNSTDIVFSVVISETKEMTSTQCDELKEKMEQIVARTNASGNADTSPFTIVANVKVTDVKTTEGGMQPMKLVQGELNLLVKNRNDGIVYNELSISLNKLYQEASKVDELTQLIRSIKPKDARFVRFIKTSQKRILNK